MTRLALVTLLVLAAGCAGDEANPVGSSPTPSTAAPAASESPPTSGNLSDATSASTAPAADAPAPSTPSGTAPVTPDTGVRPDGFPTTAAVVTKPDGTTCEVCLWLADSADARRRGLMFVTDLGAAAGMAFRYPDPHTGTFWMENTPLPLSIAFYDPDGAYLDAFDMATCDDDCPNYATPADFLVAVEVPQGDLSAVGLVAGSRLELLDAPCA